jgi:arsenate reductase
MAEGLTRHFGKGARTTIEALSAGLEPKGLHPLAVAVMDELGIDIRTHSSKGVDPSLYNQVNWIITLCSNADTRCPTIPPHILREHWPIEDPAKTSGNMEEKRAIFRKIRDEIKERIIHLLEKV